VTIKNAINNFTVRAAALRETADDETLQVNADYYNECAAENKQLAEWLTHYDDICTIIADYKAEIAEADGESAFTRECIMKRAFAKILELFGGEE
jgi:hypothetical protein